METYDEFINNILKNRGRFGCGDEYHERHHIIPRCMGGGNEKENLIDLFAKEHFIAHKLLALENPDNNSLIYAWWMMSTVKRDGRAYQLSPEEYEEAKIAFSKIHSGRVVSQETRDKQRAAAKNRCENEEYKKQFSEFQKQLWENPEYRERMVAVRIESLGNPEIRRKMSENHADMSRENNPFYGKHHTDEAKRKNSEAHKELWKDPELRKKWSESRIGIMVGAEHPGSKIVVCCDTMIVYGAVSEASRILGINPNNICTCCIGQRQHAGGYQWKYLYDQTRKDGTIVPVAISLGLITEEQALAQLNTQQND